jgi:cysteine-rich repeat protein
VFDDKAVACDDNNACTEGDTCGDGQCQPGNSVQCQDDGDDCTTTGCEPATGCIHNPITPCCGNSQTEAGEDCDDGNKTPGDGCDALCQSEASCVDQGNDKLIYVNELNACLLALGAQFHNVQWIEVKYGYTDYLDNICKEMGYSSYSNPHGGDKCGNSANMYPSHCGQGWLGPACFNGCGNTNYDGFYCQ